MSISEVFEKQNKTFKTLVEKVFGAKQVGAFPSIALSKVLDVLFEGQKWWEWEYETIEQEFQTSELRIIDNRTLPQIQALQAIRGETSLYDKEWHLFEKCVLAVSRVPVVFFWKQEPGLQNIAYVVNVARALGTPEFSEEVRYYIGAEFIGSEILWYPIPFIDECIQLVLTAASESLHLDEQVVGLRVTAKNRFDELQQTDLDKVELNFDDATDVMVGRILQVIILSKSAMDDDLAVLRLVNGALDGKVDIDNIASNLQRILADENSVGDDSPELPSDKINEVVDLTNLEDSEIDAMMDDDYAEHLMSYTDIVDGVTSSVKVAVVQGSDKKINTGVPMRGSENDLAGPMKDLEDSTWSAVVEKAEKAALDSGVTTEDNIRRTSVAVAPAGPARTLDNLFEQ